MVNSSKIFVDFSLPAEALACLRAGTLDYQLCFPERPADSVLRDGGTDPGFAEAEIAFGQPDPGAVLSARKLKWVQVSSSGMTRYDTPAFRAGVAARGIRVCNSAHVYDHACADHVFSFLLAQSRQLPVALATRDFGADAGWKAHRDACVPLTGQRLLIVGYGAIGERLRALVAPYRMAVRAVRRRARGDEGVPVITDAAGLAAALGWADHVVNILPDSEETRGFFQAARFAQMKAGAVFYNIGRGKTVYQAALRDALVCGHLGGAWLDVTDPEPLPADHFLLKTPRCYVTPHVAGGHRGEAMTLVRHFLANLRRYETGDPLMDFVM